MREAEEEESFEVEAYLDEAQVTIVKVADEFSIPLSELSLSVSPSLKRKSTRMVKAYQSANGSVESKRIDGVTEPNAYSLFDVVQPPYNLSMLSGIYEQNSHHYAAVNAKTYNTVALGFNFVPSPSTVQKLDDLEGKADKLDKFRSKLERLRQQHFDWIDSLNRDDTFTETLIKFKKDYEALGNGYLEVGRTTNGEIAYLGHIPALTMRVRRKKDGFVQMVDGNKAVFFRNFGDIETSDPINSDPYPHEVIHLKKYAPQNDYYGVPDIIPAIGAVLGSKFATTFNIDYFENKAVPRHVVIVKGAQLSPKAEQAMYEFFNTKLKGKHHRTLYVPLPTDDPEQKVEFKIEPVEAGVQEGSFIKYKDNNRDEILSAHRTPITKVSVGSGVSLAAARDADKTFKEQVTRPDQDLIEKKLNAIVREKSDVFLLSLNELSLTDEDTQSKIDERYLRMQVIVPNEVRGRMGLPGIDGGDKPVELNAQRAAEQRSEASGSDARARNRSAGATDSAGEGRNEQGAGRSSE